MSNRGTGLNNTPEDFLMTWGILFYVLLPKLIRWAAGTDH